MKVCSLYGAGFYYIPGTDTCIKLGGYVRAEYNFNGAPSGSNAFFTGGDAYWNAAQTRYYNWYARNIVTLDVRSQTEYGTLRSYVRFGNQYQTGTQGAGDTETAARSTDGFVYFDRAFIQFAGFTFGKTISVAEIWAATGVSMLTGRGAPDTGGLTVAYYTAMLGNGFSATFGVEDTNSTRRAGIANADVTAPAFGTAYTNAYGSTDIPDIVGNLRVDQAWGYASLTGVAHEVRAAYYGTAVPSSTSQGRPGDKWGWIVTGGADINLPWAKGDHFIFQASYTQGAIGHLRVGRVAAWEGGSTLTSVQAFDAIYGTTAGSLTALQLTTGWGVIAGIEHYWTPSLRTSLFGDYAAIRHNQTAKNLACNSTTGAFGASNLYGAAAGGTCNPDWNQWQVGTRTIWNPVPNLDLGLEVAYTKIEQNSTGTVTTVPASIPGGTYNLGDYDTWAVTFRAQRSFWP